MPIFNLNNSKLTPIREKSIDLEKDIQKVTEQNLETIFGLTFVRSEFSLQDFRIDTLAFDREDNTFIIIEYKRDRSFSVIDQGYAYLSLMLNNKAEFILEYNEKMKLNLKRDDVDWSQSKVMFLANSFTTYQQNAINFKDLPIELWEVKVYDNSTILYNQLISPNSKESIKSVSKNKTIESVAKEVKEYTEEDHVTKGSEGERLLNKLKEKVLLINPYFTPHPTKFYIAFRLPDNWRNIFAVWVRKDKLLIDLVRVEPKDLNDPDKRLVYRKGSKENYNVHISRMEVSTDIDLEYVVYLIKQLYDKLIDDSYITK